MPCLRDYVEYDSWGVIVKRGVEVVKPEVVKQVAREDFRESSEPNWRDDPSYHWAKKKARRV